MIWLLVACTRTNQVKVKEPDLVPFEIGRIQSSLFLETTQSNVDNGRGVAMLLMSDQEVSCDAFKLAFSDRYYYYSLLTAQSSVFEGSSGVLALFQWHHDEQENAGWEGSYPVFGYAESDGGDLERSAWVLPFSDEMTWISFTGGYARIEGLSGGGIEGDLNTRALEATYDAENCGQLAGGYYGGDSAR